MPVSCGWAFETDKMEQWGFVSILILSSEWKEKLNTINKKSQYSYFTINQKDQNALKEKKVEFISRQMVNNKPKIQKNPI